MASEVRADLVAADADARRAAQTVFGVPLVLEAGAGTGKTTVLVARVLAWCLGPGWDRALSALTATSSATPKPRAVAERVLERVVAITFTEAAAAEMEARIVTALAQVAGDEPVLGYEAAVEPGLADAHRSRAGALLAAFDRLHVQTIHAFCRRLLSNHPLEAGLHPRFAVDARGSARTAAVRDGIETRLRAMADHDDADLEELLLHGVGAPELAEMLDALLAAAVPVHAFAADPLAPERIAAFVSRLRVASDALAMALGACFTGLRGKSTGRDVASATTASNVLLARPVETQDELATLLGGLRAEWTDARVKRLGEWGSEEWGKTERAAVETNITSIEAAARTLQPLLRHALSLDVELLALVHRALVPLLEAAAAQLRDAGAESFDALLRKARDVLIEQPALAERLRRELDQLLVDEFQDTDALQCEIVAALALGGDPAARPGLFLVGDPKQSIYGWRNADIGAYMRFVARVLAEPGAVPHRLCVNYRSVPAVLDEVARVVAPAMQFKDGVQPRFQELMPSAEHARVEGSGTPDLAAIEYWVSATWDADVGALAPKTAVRRAAKREAKHLARELRRIHDMHAVPWKEVALLFRSSGDFDEYLGALRNEAIPYTVDRDRLYYQRREVLDAAALVRAVLDPSDQIAQVAVLRSAWVGVPDVAWRSLWAQKFPDALRDALEGREAARHRLREIVAVVAGSTATPDVPGLASLHGWEASLLHALDVLIALRRTWLEESVDRFIEKLRVLPLVEATEAARYPGAFRLANLGRFFRELAAALETDDAASVLRALRREAVGAPESYEGRPKDASDDAVQVMTIHGAKGLDFRHVYVLQLHKESSSGRHGPLVHALVGENLEWRLSVGEQSAVASLGADAVLARLDAVGKAEIARTLYVAMTRAKSRLVMAGCLDATQRPKAHSDFVLDARGETLRDAAMRVGAAFAAGTGTPGIADSEAARVVFLGAVQPGPPAERQSADSIAVDPARVARDTLRLGACRAAAETRQQRSFGGRASAAVADAVREAHVGDGDEEREGGSRGVARDAVPSELEVAAAVGTAIHALLERFDWDAEPVAEWEQQRNRVIEALKRCVAPSRFAVARGRATRLLDGVAGGALASRLRDLAPHVLAREFRVLVRPEAEGMGAVGYVVGAVDLVYRDPIDGEIVVADFKTDAVATSAAIAERSLHHRAQANLYRRAVMETLRLPQAPRVELWFLAASHVEVLEFGPAPGEAKKRGVRVD